jgi:hypothetical protein
MTVYNSEVRYRITVFDIRAGSGFTPYTNSTFGITSGTWTILNTDDILTKVDNPVQRINISKGGNFATGYSFGFEVTNFDFVKSILDDGVFFKNLKVTFELEINGVWYTEWTGVIDTFTRVSELKANWKCTDAGKNRNEKIGSDLVPIALNRNYNCKLPVDLKQKQEYTVRTVGTESSKDTPIWETDGGLNRLLINTYSSGNWISELDSGTQCYLTVAMGSGAGSTFRVYKYELNQVIDADISSYWFYLNEDVSDVRSIQDIQANNPGVISVVRLLSFLNRHFLSQKQVEKIHSSQTSVVEKPLTVLQNDIEFKLSNPDDYFSFLNNDNNQMVGVRAVNEDNNIENFSSLPITDLLSEVDYSPTQSTMSVRLESPLSNETLSNINDLLEKKQDVFWNIDELVFKGVGQLPSSISSFMTIEGNYKNIVISTEDNVNVMTANLLTGNTGYVLNGSDIEIDFGTEILGRINDFKSENLYNADSLSNLTIAIVVIFSFDSPYTFVRPTSYTYSGLGVKYGGILNGAISVGCNGENVQSGGIFESVGNTIEYIQENYGNVDSADINDVSYTQADSDFALFPSATVRNPAHQIVAQTDLNDILKGILYSHHLGLYFGRNGQYYLKNWLPESTVFFNGVTPVASFTDANCIDIGDIKRDNINTIVSDFELEYDLNESNGEYQKTIRIKNTGESSFNFERDTEGVSSSNSKIAEEAWELLNAGYKRIRKESQTKETNNWIKSYFSNGTGEGEALCFIRNQAGHINREHEYLSITIPYNSTNLGLELLSFISVRDLKVTSNVERLGWIVERKINTKKDLIELKLLLDISATDPFLVEIGVVQDDANEVGNEWTDDSTAIDEITDGDGK